jgi:hypothetical protein
MRQKDAGEIFHKFAVAIPQKPSIARANLGIAFSGWFR